MLTSRGPLSRNGRREARTRVPNLTAVAREMKEERVAGLGSLDQPPVWWLDLRFSRRPPRTNVECVAHVLHSADHVGLGGPSRRVVLVVRQHDLRTYAQRVTVSQRSGRAPLECDVSGMSYHRIGGVTEPVALGDELPDVLHVVDAALERALAVDVVDADEEGLLAARARRRLELGEAAASAVAPAVTTCRPSARAPCAHVCRVPCVVCVTCSYIIC